MTRGALGANDGIDWATAGPSLTNLSNPFSINRTSGLLATVSQPAGNAQLRLSTINWNGSFDEGEMILSTGGVNNGPITIDLGTNLVSGVGAQIQNDQNPSSFNAYLQAFDASDVSLGEVQISGVANTDRGSAPFIGLTTGLFNIKKLVFSVVTTVNGVEIGAQQYFGMNQLSLVRQTSPPDPNPVPEPATIASAALAGLMLGGRLLVARRRRRKTA
jgi:hypothetical protein